MSEHVYKVQCSKEKLRDIRNFVKDVLTGYGMPDVEVSTLVLAIDEVCANLIIHGHSCNVEDDIILKIDREGDSVIFTIIDKAELFDINEYEAPALEDIIKKQRKGGLGLILVKRIMDDIQISRENHFNICRLIKHT